MFTTVYLEEGKRFFSCTVDILFNISLDMNSNLITCIHKNLCHDRTLCEWGK
jgi:hypothetical protein